MFESKYCKGPYAANLKTNCDLWEAILPLNGSGNRLLNYGKGRS